MAGIGYALEKLIKRDDLLGTFQGYSIGAIISTGPWLFTIVSLMGINFLVNNWVEISQITNFRIILIYNYSFSLVLTGPVILIATRYLADGIYNKSIESSPSMLLIALGITYIIGMLSILPFYTFFVELSLVLKIAAISNYFLVASVWVVSIFLTALKDYKAYIFIYAIGMGISFFSSLFFASNYGTSGLLFGFNLGLTVIVFSTIARVFSEYPYMFQWPASFLPYFKKYWELSIGGLLFAAAIWIDKWIMWFAPEREITAGVLIYHADYDVAMFLAYLSIIPAMALFLVSSETGFNKKYQEYYSCIKNHAPFSIISSKHQNMVNFLSINFRNIFILQGAICILTIILTPQIIHYFGGHYLQLGMLRLGILGAFFHILFLFISTIFMYFDLRRINFTLLVLFLLLNGLFSYLSMQSGYEYYGYGYFLATLLTFIISLIVLVKVLNKLPYYTFIKNNLSAN